MLHKYVKKTLWPYSLKHPEVKPSRAIAASHLRQELRPQNRIFARPFGRTLKVHGIHAVHGFQGRLQGGINVLMPRVLGPQYKDKYSKGLGFRV